MSEELRAEERLQLAQWHLTRADGLRLGLVNRAGTLLSADALVITGVVFASGATSSDVSPVIGAAALLALVVSAGSAALAASVLTGFRRLPGMSRPAGFPVPIAFGYGDTVGAFGSPEEFRSGFSAQSVEAAADSAVLELWRCISVHQLRARRMQRATQCLLAGAALLVVMAAARLVTALA
ncbi:hypothetical protein OG618_35290 [Kitasatospora sp. NBC_01246]|uniref:hypothetical protein n=1 Tax=Kitasatospora sp. NBC_01246 TaxID=2903570 RepID=UPI002E37873A|nr:hypothetical protein [Kitasatospora sp. NBC_01246]